MKRWERTTARTSAEGWKGDQIERFHSRELEVLIVRSLRKTRPTGGESSCKFEGGTLEARRAMLDRMSSVTLGKVSSEREPSTKGSRNG